MPQHNAKKPPVNLLKTLVATCVGNVLEWFDITIYAYFAVYIARTFFPTDDEALSLIITFGTFAVSFLIRPIGAIVLGNYADRHGRKKALLVSILLMTIGSAMIAFMPSYAAIGMAAPILVLLARLIQGFSAGGEFGSSTAFLVEHFPRRRTFVASWQFATQGMSTLLAAGFGLGLVHFLSEAQMYDWGWRVPFLFGLLIGPVGLYIRRHLPESNTQVEKSEFPVKELFLKHKTRMLVAIGLLVVSTGINYLFNYIPTYAVKNINLSSDSAYFSVFISGVILTIVTPLAGLAAEKYGRRVFMWTAITLLVVSIYPAFSILAHLPSSLTLVLFIAWLALLKAIYFAMVPSMMSDLFPAATRASGMAISYNISVTIFGGFSPLIMSVLISQTGNNLVPGYYLIVLAFISAAAIIGSTRYLKEDR